MKWCVLLLALLQSLLCCSGLPLYNSEMAVMADRGLAAALTEVNTVYAVSHLYRVTRGSVTRVIPVAMNTYDLLLSFGVKESACLKSSRQDPQGCAFRPGFFVPSSSCVSRVRVTAVSAQVVALRCGHGASSSSESSSEEIFSRGRQHVSIPSFVNRDPAPQTPPPPPPPPAAPAAPAAPGRSVLRQEEEPAAPAGPGRSVLRQEEEEEVMVVPRGDVFSNYLE